MSKRKKKAGRKAAVGVIAAVVAAAAGILIYLNVRDQGEQPEELLDTYFQELALGDYESMYGQLSRMSRQETDQERFAERNQRIYEGMEAENITVSQSEPEDGENGEVVIPYTVSMDTLAGSLNLSNRAVYVREDGEYRLEWTDSMIFPDLTEKDTVRISRNAAERGGIYDRNGVMLAGEQIASQVGLVPGKMAEDPQTDLETLSELLGISTESIQSALDASWVKEDSFVPLKTLEKVNDIQIASGQGDQDDLENQQLQSRLLEIPGVMISDTSVRGILWERRQLI